MFQPPGISSGDFFCFLLDTFLASLMAHDNWPRMRRHVIRIQRSHGTIKSVQDPNGNLCGPLIMNKIFRNMADVKKHTTANIVIVLEGEQHLLTPLMLPSKIYYVHTGKFVGETVLLHVYNTILNAGVHAQTTFLLSIRERCNMRHSPSKATITRLMLQSVRASWMLNCYFLSDSGVGILAFLCVVIKDKRI